MSKHKSEDYKISAVQYYIDNDTSFTETCRIFKCSERSLKRWIERYNNEKSIKRHNRPSISYKITKEQVKYAIKKLKVNEQITMSELVKLVKKKYKDFDITPYLVDEFRTSCKCSKCDGVSCEKFMGCLVVKTVRMYGIEIVMEQKTSTK